MNVINNIAIQISNSLTDRELKEFGMLYLRDIASQYPFSTERSADDYINSHLGLMTPSVSTRARTIWKGIINNAVFGYTLVTEKDGKSIKFGPTIIKKRYRGRKLASYFRLEVEKIYEPYGYVYAYSTTQEHNLPAQNYAVNAGYKEMVSMNSHFITGIKEVVLRKKISNASFFLGNHDDNETLIISDLYDIEESALSKILNQNNTSDFLKSEVQILGKTYKIFQKHALSFACLPKKGNSLKIIPLYLEVDSFKIANLLDQIIDNYKSQFNNIYTYVPCGSKFENLLIDLSFSKRGRISKIIKGKVIDLTILAKTI